MATGQAGVESPNVGYGKLLRHRVDIFACTQYVLGLGIVNPKRLQNLQRYTWQAETSSPSLGIVAMMAVSFSPPMAQPGLLERWWQTSPISFGHENQ